MIFYLIPAAKDQPQELAGTQNDARDLCRRKGLRFDPSKMTHDVPTSKWDLMNYINSLMATSVIDEVPQMDGIERAQIETHYDVSTKPALTQAQVDEMFSGIQPAKPATLDEVCHAIAEMRGAAIGHVAHELAARIERLGKEVA